MKTIITIIVLILIVVGLGYFINQEPASTETGPITIGFLGPLTGDAAALGEPARNIVAIAVEEINADGGIDGRELVVVYEDGKCAGKDATNAAQKLINVDGVKVIIGGLCSGESLAAVPVAEAGKVFLVSPGSSSPDLTDISDYFVRTYPSDATQGSVLAEAAFERGWTKVGFMSEQTDYAIGVHKAFDETFTSLGGEVVLEDFATGVNDFRTALAKLRDAEVDALFVNGQTPAASERILQQFSDLEWETNLLLNDVIAGDAAIVEANAEYIEGALFALFGIDGENEILVALSESYMEAHGVELPFMSYAQTEYDAVYMLADGLREVGEDPDKLAKWFRSEKNWTGASGVVDIADNGDRVGGHMLKQIVNGEGVDVVEE